MNQFVETIKIKKGEVMALPYHQARMERTIRHFFPSLSAMPSLAQLIAPRADMQLSKCRVVYSEQGVEAVEYAPYAMRTIQTLMVIEADNIDYSYKSTDRSEINRLTTLKGDCDDIVIVKNGLITDTSFTNLAIFDGHEFLLAQGAITEKDLTPEDLKNSEKTRLFNAMIDFGEIEIINTKLDFRRFLEL